MSWPNAPAYLAAAALAVGLLVGTPSTRAANPDVPPGVTSLAGVWLFHPGDNGAFARPRLDDFGWEQRRLPMDDAPWELRWQGYGWYRYHLQLDHSALGQNTMLTLGPAREVVEVYFNGSLVAERGVFGSRPRGGSRVTQLAVAVPGGLVKAGDNVIALRIYDPSWSGGIATGPLWVGPQTLIRSSIESLDFFALSTRISLGFLAFFLGLASVVVQLGRRSGRDGWWLFGAGLALAALHLGGTGLLTTILPSLTLAVRLPLVANALSILFMASFFAARFGDSTMRIVTTGRAVLLILAAILLLLPDAAVFFVGEPTSLMVALICALYVAHLIAQGARRQEPGALVIFASLIGLVLLMLYDGLTASSTDTLPPISAVGAVGVLLVVTVVAAWQATREHESVLQTMLRLRRRVDGNLAMGILDVTAMSITDSRAFLEVVVQEAAWELQVRRCSLVLQGDDNVLRVRAGVGLERAAIGAAVPRDEGIAAWVFEHGETVTDGTVPEALKRPGRGNYLTDAFICQPLTFDGETLGVLSVADRNDSAPFSVSHEIAVSEVASKLALVISRLGGMAEGEPQAADRRKTRPLEPLNTELEFEDSSSFSVADIEE